MNYEYSYVSVPLGACLKLIIPCPSPCTKTTPQLPHQPQHKTRVQARNVEHISQHTPSHSSQWQPIPRFSLPPVLITHFFLQSRPQIPPSHEEKRPGETKSNPMGQHTLLQQYNLATFKTFCHNPLKKRKELVDKTYVRVAVNAVATWGHRHNRFLQKVIVEFLND